MRKQAVSADGLWTKTSWLDFAMKHEFSATLQSNQHSWVSVETPFRCWPSLQQNPINIRSHFKFSGNQRAPADPRFLHVIVVLFMFNGTAWPTQSKCKHHWGKNWATHFIPNDISSSLYLPPPHQKNVSRFDIFRNNPPLPRTQRRNNHNWIRKQGFEILGKASTQIEFVTPDHTRTSFLVSPSPCFAPQSFGIYVILSYISRKKMLFHSSQPELLTAAAFRQAFGSVTKTINEDLS